MNEAPKDLLERLHANEADAWGDAFRALYPIAWRGCGHARWNLSEQDREEAAADALAEVGRRIQEMTSWAQVTAYVFVIARRKSVSRLRAQLAQKRKAKEGADVSLNDLEEVQIAHDEIPSMSKWGDLSATLERLLAILGEPASTLVREYTFDGLTYEQIATKHRMPIGTVAVNIYRAMQRLRKELSGSPKLMKELSLYLRLFMMA